MSNLKNSIAIKINQDKLLANLEFSFSNKSTVLGELMQNARRAGATRVTFSHMEGGTLLISDDGKGIDDFQNLFSVAESGWDAQTVQNERPFGMGWLSCLYAAEAIYVESNGKYIEGKSSEILAGGSLDVKAVDDEDAPKRNYTYTQVVLKGFSLEANALENALEKLAEGFAIPVFFNGKELSHKYALSTSKDGEFLSVPGIGDIKVKHINLENNFRSDLLTVGMKFYLQGLPVFSTSRWDGDISNVVHLDSTQWFARMPDRDKLTNEADAIQKINKAINQIHLDRLLAMKASMTAKEFATQAIAEYAMHIEGGFEVLCNQDVHLSNKFGYSYFVIDS